MEHLTFDRLPERLTISFPLWLIYGTKGEYSPYDSRTNRRPVDYGWYERVAKHNDIDRKYL